MRPRRDQSGRPSPLLDRLFRWGPVLLWMGGIFLFSSRPNPLGPVSRSKWSDVVGQAAHVGEYGGLAALVYRALSRSEAGLRAALISLGVTLGYAVLDEMHQGFVPGRELSPIDVGCDAVGAIMALGVIAVWKGARRGTRGTA